MKTILKSFVVVMVLFILITNITALDYETNNFTTADRNEFDAIIDPSVSPEREKFIANACDAICADAPYLCKVAFCAVILNRCMNSSFPNTPAEVIFLDPEFCEGHSYDYNAKPSNDAIMAYNDAVSGFSPCPEALYFYKASTQNIALKRRRILFKIGRFVFS